MTHNPNSPGGSDSPAPIDKTLKRFFASEVPHPWPTAPELTVAVAQRNAGPSLWQKVSQYVSIAVVLALLVFGYYTLCGQFPTISHNPEDSNQMKALHNIASNPGIPNQPMDIDNDK